MLSPGVIVKRCSCVQIEHSPAFFLYHKSSIVAFLTVIPCSPHWSSAIRGTVTWKGRSTPLSMVIAIKTEYTMLIGPCATFMSCVVIIGISSCVSLCLARAVTLSIIRQSGASGLASTKFIAANHRTHQDLLHNSRPLFHQALSPTAPLPYPSRMMREARFRAIVSWLVNIS